MYATNLLSPESMHLPDGFLSVAVSLVLWLVSIGVITYALQRANQEIGERHLPLMGVLAAAIFAGQMLNFSVAGGTSGHLMGAALATILLGPWAAVLVMTTVVGVQALVFQDGGLLALGANIFNMGVVGVAVSYFIYQTVYRLTGEQRRGIFAGGALAAWASIEAAALVTGIELAFSGTSPANIAIPAMVGIHALIGLGEAFITLGALAFIYSARPDLFSSGQNRAAGKMLWGIGLAIAIGLAIFSPLASSHPDGLEWVAEQKGFLSMAQAPLFKLIPDYVLPGIPNQSLATIVAGVSGVLIVLGVALAVAYTRRKRSSSRQ